MSLERKARQRLIKELKQHSDLTLGRIVDIVRRELGIRELAYAHMFTPPYYVATAGQMASQTAAMYDAFVSEAKRHTWPTMSRVPS